MARSQTVLGLRWTNIDADKILHLAMAIHSAKIRAAAGFALLQAR